jgi:hypothetical protein
MRESACGFGRLSAFPAVDEARASSVAAPYRDLENGRTKVHILQVFTQPGGDEHRTFVQKERPGDDLGGRVGYRN